MVCVGRVYIDGVYMYDLYRTVLCVHFYCTWSVGVGRVHIWAYCIIRVKN